MAGRIAPVHTARQVVLVAVCLVGLARAIGPNFSTNGTNSSHDPSGATTGTNSSQPTRHRRKEVLLVIDMQNDYSVAYNFEQYGYLRNPWLSEHDSPIEDVVRQQVELINAPREHWDLIVFTQDWLIPSTIASIGFPGPANITNNSFCIRDTPGAEPFEVLLDAAAQRQPNQFRYTKSLDNAFNDVSPLPWVAGYVRQSQQEPVDYPPIPADYPNRGYDSNNTHGGKPLTDVLADRGYAAEDTRLTIAGTVSDMCVLTSALDALVAGFQARVFVPGLNGGSTEADAEWSRCVDGQPGPDACCVPSPREIARHPRRHAGWQERAANCQAAAGLDNALRYMRLAGAKLLHRVPRHSLRGGQP